MHQCHKIFIMLGQNVKMKQALGGCGFIISVLKIFEKVSEIIFTE